MTLIKEKILKKLRNYGYTTIARERDAEFIIDRTLKEIKKLIDEVRKGNNDWRELEELKARIGE